jgi:hypothetical protein
MIFGMILMFLMISLIEGTVAWLVWSRLADHMRECPEAIPALSEHLFCPLVGSKKTDGKAPNSQ